MNDVYYFDVHTVFARFVYYMRQLFSWLNM